MKLNRTQRTFSNVSLETALFLRELLTADPSRMSSPQILAALDRRISSLEEGSGPSQLDLLDGLTTDRSGQAPAPASPSPSPAKAPEQTIQGTYGRTFIGSLPPAGPLSSWENRLRERLGMVGSMEFDLIWKEKVTPAGLLISRLAPSTRRTSDSGFTGSQWATPRARDWKDGSTVPPSRQLKPETATLGQQVAIATTWSTPTVQDSENCAGPSQWSRNSQALNVQAAATWPTPTAVNRVRDEETLAKCAAFRKRNANQNTVPLYLGEVAHGTATWPTPMTPSGGRVAPGGTSMTGQTPDGRKVQVTTELVAFGTMPSGSQAQTGKRGALNPEFVFWLMLGSASDAWVSCALEAMQSLPRSRRKSSVR